MGDANQDTIQVTDHFINEFNAELEGDKFNLRKPIITNLNTANETKIGDKDSGSLTSENIKIRKVKKGAAKGVLGFENVTEGENIFTKVVFKPFVMVDGESKAEIKEEDLRGQPLFNFKGDEPQQKIERAIASNSGKCRQT